MGSVGVLEFAGNKRPKTIDVGHDGTTASVDYRGMVLGLTTFHPEHGIIVAEPFEQFPGDRFHDSEYVREHRARMLRCLASGVAAGYGIRVDHPVPCKTVVEYQRMNCASIEQSFDDGIRIDTTIAVTGEKLLVQHHKISNDTDVDNAVPWTCTANISVNRASYGQLTEKGPIPPPKCENEVEISDNGATMTIFNRHLGAHIVGVFEIEGKMQHLGEHIQQQGWKDKPVEASVNGVVAVPAQGCKSMTAKFRFQSGVSAKPLPGRLKFSGDPEAKFWREYENTARFIIRRNLDYILGSCSVPLSSSADVVCIITDHVALPLGWNRDNYWQSRFLMDAWQFLKTTKACRAATDYLQRIQVVLKGHLRWVFEYAQRPHGYWHRSYLTTGKPKDGPVFQLDQQCYPFLELADHCDMFPDETEFVRTLLRKSVVRDIVDVIAARMDPSTGLVATEETPADDPVEFAYHLSSHILLWYTLKRLGYVLRTVVPDADQLMARVHELATSVRKAASAHFLKPDPNTGELMWVYLTDGRGQVRTYHDSNDVITLLAKGWGFLESSDEVKAWENTLRFANTPANVGGYYTGGQYEGLGSVHSPAPWPLGFFQMWRFGQIMGNAQQEDETWEQICGAMQHDGTFGEAVDAVTGKCISKAWFSWPGSMIGSGLLRKENRPRYLGCT